MDEWRDYRNRHGFPEDRIVWTLALGFSRLCQLWGSKCQPRDFIPKPADTGNKALVAALSAIPGAKVRKRPHKERKHG